MNHLIMTPIVNTPYGLASTTADLDVNGRFVRLPLPLVELGHGVVAAPQVAAASAEGVRLNFERWNLLDAHREFRPCGGLWIRDATSRQARDTAARYAAEARHLDTTADLEAWGMTIAYPA